MGFKPLTYNTPPEEEAHIFAEDDAAIFQSIFGEDGVFAIGDRMKATVINNNQVRVGNGILCVGGHIGRTVYGDYSDMTIENGEISKNRNDIITAVFSTTGEKGIDEFKIEVKKGTPGVVAEDPELTKENLYEGGKLREFPLWRVKLEGINIIGVEQMFKIIPKIPDLEEKIELLNGKITNAVFFKDFMVDNKILEANSTEYFDVPAPVIKEYSREISSVSILNAISAGANSSFCTIYQQKINGGNARIAVRNNGSTRAKIKIEVLMKYISDTIIAKM